ncbi:MAG: DUF2785 domain-containing protein, partial [Caldimonas sp.]
GKCLKIVIDPRRLAVAALLLCFACVASAACPPSGMSKASLEALKAAGWKVADEARRQSLAIEMLDCLGAPDPALRDDLAFEALSHWARARELTAATLQSMRAALVPRLVPGTPDDAGFRRPFSALTLAEVARADRVQPFLSAAERHELVGIATTYLVTVRDYRGFDAKDGWRHGVAHGADLLLQLALNPAVDNVEQKLILAAIATQVMPPGAHFYVYGEGDRLMTPVFYIGRRDALTGEEWSAWFAALTAQRTKADPATQGSLAARHNLSQFLLELYASLKESGTLEMQARMLPGVVAAIKTLN